MMHDLLLALGLSLPIAGLGLVVMRPFLARLTRIPEAAWIVLQLGSLSPLFLFLGLSEGIALLPPSTYPLPDLPPLLGEAGLGLTGDKSSARPSFVQSWPLALFCVWILGLCGRLGLELRRQRRLKAVLDQARPVTAREQARLDNVMKETELRRIPVLMTDQGISPFTTGIWRAKIILPQAQFTTLEDQALRHILAHEYAHIARHDDAKYGLSRLIGLVLWFNPFWFALERSRRIAVEQACDALALSSHETSSARAYARTLVDGVRAGSGAFASPGFGVDSKKALTMRLTALLKPRPNTKTTLLGLSAALSLFIAPMALAQVSYIYLSAAGPVQFLNSPLAGETTSGYGPRHIPNLDVPRFHRGHDIKAAAGTEIIAPAPGEVMEAENVGRYGNRIIIDHGEGWQTVYAHLQGFAVRVGDRVQAGDVLGYVGSTGVSTGPHLHVEVYHNGQHVDPADHLPGLATP